MVILNFPSEVVFRGKNQRTVYVDDFLVNYMKLEMILVYHFLKFLYTFDLSFGNGN